MFVKGVPKRKTGFVGRSLTQLLPRALSKEFDPVNTIGEWACDVLVYVDIKEGP